MSNRIFKDRSISAAYRQYRGYWKVKDPRRVAGTSLEDAYRKGFLYPDRKNLVMKGSIAYGAWAAGVDDFKEVAKKVSDQLPGIVLDLKI